MEDINQIITLTSTGAAVEELHILLQKIGYVIPSNEKADSFFGVGTRDALIMFQTKNKLPRTGMLDPETLSALKRLVSLSEKQQYQLNGRLRFNEGQPAGKIKLLLYNRTIGSRSVISPIKQGPKAIANATTDNNGYYSFKFILPKGASKPNLEVRALQSDNTEIALSGIRYQAGYYEIMHLKAPQALRPIESEYQRLMTSITSVLGKKPLKDIKENSTQRDISILHQTIQWDARLIALAWIAARVQNTNHKKMTSEVLYGIFRVGLPWDLGLLANVPYDTVKKALALASRKGIISVSAANLSLEDFQNFKRSFQKNYKAPGTVSTMEELIGNEPELIEAYLEPTNSLSSFWEKVPTDKRDILKLKGKLHYLTENNAILSEAIFSVVFKNKKINELPLGKLLVEAQFDKKEKWVEVIGNPGLSGIPEKYHRTTIEESTNAYAEALARKICHSFPSKITLKKLLEDKLGFSVPDNTQNFLRNLEEKGFDLSTTPFYNFVNKHDINEIRGKDVEYTTRLQRIYQITPNDKSLSVLLNKGFQSAQEIASMSYPEFYNQVKISSNDNEGCGPQEARLIYRKAQQVNAVIKNIHSNIQHWHSSPPVYTIDATPKDIRDLLKKVFGEGNNTLSEATIEELFGSLDFCSCEHCRSVLSPAAYFVDLLKLLDPKTEIWNIFLSDWKNKQGIDYPSTILDATNSKPIDVLNARRPDLLKLALTCENTNTVLPYIDIVNEIFECYIGETSTKKSECFYNSSADISTEQLLAEPQNVSLEVYEKLKSCTGSIPMGLPFDLWLETSRQWLSQSGIPLWKFLEVFRSSDVFDKVTNDGKDYGWKSIWIEQLGISPSEEALYTQGFNISKWYFLYGYSSTPDLKELTKVTEISRRLGVSYKELEQLLCTTYLNNTIIWEIDGNDPCNTTTAKLIITSNNSSEKELWRLNILVRLWRKLQWPLSEIDCALNTFSKIVPDGEEDMNTALLCLAHLQDLDNRLNNGHRKIQMLIALWTNISNPLYMQLFPHIPVLDLNFAIIQGSLQITFDEINMIFEHNKIHLEEDTKLSLENLSVLYRYSYLAKAMNLSVRDIISLIQLSGVNPFEPFPNESIVSFEKDVLNNTIRFIEISDKIRTSGFSIEDLEYLFQHKFDPYGKFRLLQEEQLTFIKLLEAGIEEVRNEHPLPFDQNTWSDAEIDKELSILLPKNIVKLFMQWWVTGILNELSAEQKEIYYQYFLPFFPDLKGFKALFPVLRSTMDLEFDSRRRKILSIHYIPYLQDILVKQFIQTQLEKQVKLSKNLLNLLLNDVKIFSIGKQKLIDFLTDIGKQGNTQEYYELQGTEHAVNVMVQLDKISQIIQLLGFSDREVKYILSNSEYFDSINWSKLPVELETDSSMVNASLKQLMRLIDYRLLKNEMAGGTDDTIEVFEMATKLSVVDKLSEPTTLFQKIAALTRREEGTINAVAKLLMDTKTMNIDKTTFFTQEKDIKRLWEILKVLQKLGVPFDVAKKWREIIQPENSSNVPYQKNIADEIKEAVKSRYKPEQWLQVARPISDRLRQNKRDALVAYLLDQDQDGLPYFENVNQLYEYFLIDPGTEPMVQTSRIRLAISSVQLFIQRCLLNLEDYLPPDPNVIDAQKWQWMKRYRIWEANRKIFLYPENWLEPEFRDNKSHIFMELEGALLKGDVSDDMVQQVFSDYLIKLEEIARLEIITTYLEEKEDPDTNIVHVIGCTQQIPRQYYYRHLANSTWTPWEPVPLEIEGEHIVITKWEERIYLFWVNFPEKAPNPEPNSDIKSDACSTNSSGTKRTIQEESDFQLTKSINNIKKKRLDVQLSWSEYFKSQWSPRKTSNFGTLEIEVNSNFDPKKVFIYAETTENRYAPGCFKILLINTNRTDQADVGNTGDTGMLAKDPAFCIKINPNNLRGISFTDGQGPLLTPSLAFAEAKTTKYFGKGKLIYTNKNTNNADGIILNQAGVFSIAPAVNARKDDNIDEYRKLSMPFFFQDDQNTFWVEPTLIEVPIDEWEGIGIGHLGETEGVDIVPDDIVSADIPNSCETNGDLEHIDPSPGPTEKKRENWLTDPFSVLKIDDGYIYREGFLEWFDVDKWIPTPEPDPEVVLEPDTIITFNPGNDVPIDKITVSKIKIENELQQIIDSGKSINAIGAKGMNQLMVNGIKQAIKERQTKIVMK